MTTTDPVTDLILSKVCTRKGAKEALDAIMELGSGTLTTLCLHAGISIQDGSVIYRLFERDNLVTREKNRKTITITLNEEFASVLKPSQQ